MPKIRNKKSEIEYFDKNRSGVLTKAYKKILTDSDNHQGFFPLVIGNNTNNSDCSSNPYYDNNTIVFKKEFAHMSIGSEINNIVHTPSSLNGDIFNLKNINNKTINTNNDIKNSYNIDFKPYIDKEAIEKNYDYFNINLKFNDLKLCMNKNKNFYQTIEINNNVYECLNAPTVLWNKKNRWDYVGDITQNYFNDINSFLNAPIAFNCLSFYDEKLNQSEHDIGGKPITTFGFPYDVKFQPKDDHELNAGDYISEDFYLKKIIVKFKNNLIKDEILQKPLLSYLNFFILNVRKKSNESLYLQKDIENANKYKFVFEDIVIQNTRNFSLSDADGEIRKFSYFENENIIVEENDDCVTNEIKYIDVISYGNELIYFDSIDENKNIYNENFLQSNSELQYIHTENFKTIELNVKDTKSFGYCDYFSNFKIYPSKFNENKNFMNQNSNRCTTINSEIFSSNSHMIEDTFYQKINIFDKTSINSDYLLKTTDKLVLGISFSTPCNIVDEENYSKEIMYILDNITFTFLGEYKNNENRVSFTSNSDLNSINSYRLFNGNSHIFYKNKTDEKTSSYNQYQNKIIDRTGANHYKISNKGLISSRKLYLNLLYEYEKSDENSYDKLYYLTDDFGQSFNNLNYTIIYNSEQDTNITRLFINQKFEYFTPIQSSYLGNIDIYSRIQTPYIEE